MTKKERLAIFYRVHKQMNKAYYHIEAKTNLLVANQYVLFLYNFFGKKILVATMLITKLYAEITE